MDLEEEEELVDRTDPTIDPSTYELKSKKKSSSNNSKRDFSEEFVILRAQALTLPNLNDAIELLLALEKKSRLAGDSKTCLEVCLFILTLCGEQHKNFTQLGHQVTLLFKRRSQFKSVQEKIVQHTIPFLKACPSVESELDLIHCLRHLSEGKLFLEVERARLTRRLAQILESQQKVNQACEVLQEEQVENYGGLDRREKVDYLLEQIRFVLGKRDFVRLGILGKKIQKKWLQGPEMMDLKVRFYSFMVQLHAHEGNFFEMAQDFLQMSEGCTNEEDTSKQVQLCGLCLCLAPKDSHSHSLILSLLKKFKKPLDGFVGHLLQRLVTQELCPFVSPDGKVVELLDSLHLPSDWQQVMKVRIVEHNIRVCSKVYTRITLKRLAEFLGLDENETEVQVSQMVTSSSQEKLACKMDRLTGIVYFGKRKDANLVLSEQLGGDLEVLLNLVEVTIHEIHKENMMHGIAS